jgi:hypothetical protein
VIDSCTAAGDSWRFTTTCCSTSSSSPPRVTVEKPARSVVTR